MIRKLNINRSSLLFGVAHKGQVHDVVPDVVPSDLGVGASVTIGTLPTRSEPLPAGVLASLTTKKIGPCSFEVTKWIRLGVNKSQKIGKVGDKNATERAFLRILRIWANMFGRANGSPRLFRCKCERNGRKYQGCLLSFRLKIVGGGRGIDLQRIVPFSFGAGVIDLVSEDMLPKGVKTTTILAYKGKRAWRTLIGEPYLADGTTFLPRGTKRRSGAPGYTVGFTHADGELMVLPVATFALRGNSIGLQYSEVYGVQSESHVDSVIAHELLHGVGRWDHNGSSRSIMSIPVPDVGSGRKKDSLPNMILQGDICNVAANLSLCEGVPCCPKGMGKSPTPSPSKPGSPDNSSSDGPAEVTKLRTRLGLGGRRIVDPNPLVVNGGKTGFRLDGGSSQVL